MSAATTQGIVRYVALAFGYWGAGETEEEALANCRKAGAKKSERTILYRNVRPAEKAGKEHDPTVDDYGNIGYYGTNTKIAEYKKNKRTSLES